MRIAIIYLGRRGAGGRIALEIARQLDREHRVLVVVSRLAENLEHWRKTSVQRVDVNTFGNAIGALFSLIFPIQIHRVAERIRQTKPDALLFPMFHPWNSLIQKALRDVPSVVFVHDPHPHPDLAGWFYDKLENQSFRRAARGVVMSEVLKPALIQRGITEERIDVIPIGPLRYKRAARSQKALDQPPTLLFFGRIAPYKGIEHLLDAYRLVRETTPCRLSIVGRGNLRPYRERLKGLEDVEIINHWVAEEEIGEWFARSDLVTLPYASASQSGVIPIAATFGLPVIATRTGGLPEQIEAGISGWLVPPGDVHALAEAIREALNNPTLARQRGLELKERYERVFNWGQIVRQVEISLEKAMQARGPE